MNIVVGKQAAYSFQIFEKKIFRRNPVNMNSLCRLNAKVFSIVGWYVNLPLCFGTDILVGTQPVWLSNSWSCGRWFLTDTGVWCEMIRFYLPVQHWRNRYASCFHFLPVADVTTKRTWRRPIVLWLLSLWLEILAHVRIRKLQWSLFTMLWYSKLSRDGFVRSWGQILQNS